MNFQLSIDCDNAAFEDDLEGELTRILKIVAHRVQDGERFSYLHDVNGNLVGDFAIGEETS